MNDLPSEVLLSIFKSLESKEMVKVMRTCRRWYEIIDDNVTAWNAFVLKQDDDEDYFDFKAGLKRFRIKSGGLKEVCIQPEINLQWEYDIVDDLCQELERNKGSLKYLDLSQIPSDNLDQTCVHESLLSDLAWKIPSLVDFRVETTDYFTGSNNVRLLHSKLLRSRAQEASNIKVPSLRILSAWGSRDLLDSNLKVLSNLTSLSLGISLTSDHWKQVLKEPSQTLKHLHLRFYSAQSSDERALDIWNVNTLPEPEHGDQSIDHLDFPALQVFEFEPSEPNFPTWMRIPPTSSLILISNSSYNVRSIARYPKVHQLWFVEGTTDFNIKTLTSACPSLERLRYLGLFSQLSLPKMKSLLEMLSERKGAAQAGWTAGGIQIRAIKQLTLNLEGVEAATLKALKKLVPEVIDSREVPHYIDVEVEI